LLGLFGQIRDDLMNLQSAEVSTPLLIFPPYLYQAEQYTSKKGFADDLTEGKFSFPVIHAIQADPGNREVLSAVTGSLGSFTALTQLDYPCRRPPTTAINPDTENPYHRLPQEPHKVI
jgi:Polyprenyl synthetase